MLTVDSTADLGCGFQMVPVGSGFFFDIHLQVLGIGSPAAMGCDFRTWGKSRIGGLGDGPHWDKGLISVFFHLFVESS